MRLNIALLIVAFGIVACTGRRETTPAPVDRVQPTTKPAAPSTTGVSGGEPRSKMKLVPLSSAQAREKGVFDELGSKVKLHDADWVDRSAGLVVQNRHGDSFLFVDGVPIALVGGVEPDLIVDDFGTMDQDNDGFPDQLDILIGAKKAAVNNAPYGSPYREIDYPGGDVPRTEGVCTDVIVRAVRNAGPDLQQSLHEDIKRAPRAFPMVKKPNPNIDHRRVKTLLPHFERQWTSLPVDDDIEPWLPGDIVFMQTMGDPRPDHLGVVSDRLGVSGAPLIINNWTDGFATSAMDVGRLAPITQRFRIGSRLQVPTAEAGLQGLLKRQGLEVPTDSRQVIAVTGFGWNSIGATLRRYERRDDIWVAVGQPVRATVGAAGLGAGRGLHREVDRATVEKREGDQRAPAGVFDLGTAFGRADALGGSWPYRQVNSTDRFVDDSKSPHYNSWQVSTGADNWSSAEQLDHYVLGLVVEHNVPAEANRGSAIFLHTWQGEPTATLGCTAMARADVLEVLKWLKPEARPVLVQVAGQLFEEAK